MRKLIRILFIFLLVAVLVIQFFQPDKNTSDKTSGHIFEVEANIPSEIKQILTTACLDCHSNNTNYKWYHKPAPVSWMINKHILEGKDELNLSEWGKFDIYDKIGTLEEICEETERKTMPLKSYTSIHREAKLTDEQISKICDWTEKLSEELLAAVSEE